MPEKGWYSITIRKETALKVRELAKNKNLTVNELINVIMKPTSKGAWSTCTLCGVRVKAGARALGGEAIARARKSIN